MSEQEVVETRKKRRMLNHKQRSTVMRMICAGNSNVEIMTVMAGMGITITHSHISVYRHHPKVRAAFEELFVEAIQSGMGQRSKRVMELSEVARNIIKRMSGKIYDEEGVLVMERPVPLVTYLVAARELRGVLMDIEKMVGALPGQASLPQALVQKMEESTRKATAGEEVPIEGNILGMMVDALEQHLIAYEAKMAAECVATELPVDALMIEAVKESDE